MKKGEANEPVAGHSRARRQQRTPNSVNVVHYAHGPEENQVPPFDYLDFMEFNRLQALLSQVQLLNKDKENEADTPKEPSREEVMKKFTEMYGPVDFESPGMEQILEQMKEAIMEQEVPDLEEVKTLLMALGIEAHSLLQAEEQLKNLITLKFGDKKALYTTFSPREANGEWFVLPRGDPTLIRWENFEEMPPRGTRYANELPSGSQKPEEKEKKPDESRAEAIRRTMLTEKTRPLTNLHLYDPKFEFCYQKPYRIFRSDPKGYASYDAIPKMISLRILEHLNDFPFGISPTHFWDSYYNIHRKEPKIFRIKSKEILNYHRDEIWFVKDNSGVPATQRLPDLMFPSFLENVVCPEKILKRVWHSINCTISRENYVSSDELFILLEDIYSIPFHYRDWGFKTIEAFITFCTEKFGTKNLTTHRVFDRSFKECVDYVMIDKMYWKGQVENFHRPAGSHNFPLERRYNSLEAYLEHGHGINGSRFKNLDLLECDLLEITDDTLGKLFIFMIQRSRVEKLEDFMKKLQRHKTVLKSHRKPVINDTVRYGMYVLALIEKGKAALWYRVRIVKKDEKKQRYTVYAIDYGFFHEVLFWHVSYLPKGEIAWENAYAIPATVEISDDTKQGLEGLGRNLKDMIYDIVRKHSLRVMTINGEYNQNLGCNEWIVKCNLMTPKPDDELISPDLAAMLTQRYEDLVLGRKETGKKRVVAKKAADLLPAKDQGDEKGAKKGTVTEESKAVEKVGELYVKRRIVPDDSSSSAD